MNATMEEGKEVLRSWVNTTFVSDIDTNDFRGLALKEGAQWLLKYVEQLDFGNDTLHAVSR